MLLGFEVVPEFWPVLGVLGVLGVVLPATTLAMPFTISLMISTRLGFEPESDALLPALLATVPLSDPVFPGFPPVEPDGGLDEAEDGFDPVVDPAGGFVLEPLPDVDPPELLPEFDGLPAVPLSDPPLGLFCATVPLSEPGVFPPPEMTPPSLPGEVPGALAFPEAEPEGLEAVFPEEEVEEEPAVLPEGEGFEPEAVLPPSEPPAGGRPVTLPPSFPDDEPVPRLPPSDPFDEGEPLDVDDDEPVPVDEEPEVLFAVVVPVFAVEPVEPAVPPEEEPELAVEPLGTDPVSEPLPGLPAITPPSLPAGLPLPGGEVVPEGVEEAPPLDAVPPVEPEGVPGLEAPVVVPPVVPPEGGELLVLPEGAPPVVEADPEPGAGMVPESLPPAVPPGLGIKPVSPELVASDRFAPAAVSPG